MPPLHTIAARVYLAADPDCSRGERAFLLLRAAHARGTHKWEDMREALAQVRRLRARLGRRWGR